MRRLGRGGYAEVFLYEQVSPHMPVAVKVLFGDALSDRAREQFAAEANAMAELADHPYIVQVFRADVTSDGRPYMVMKYYPQHNLAVRARSERISVPEVLQIGVRIACAVETAHRAGILHRDIKPANILTSQYGEPGLTDFGIATTGEATSDSDGLSIPWSPPEAVFGTSRGDRTGDVYSMGATLWHLLAGHSPFQRPGSDNGTASLMRRIREEPVSRTGRDDVPRSLERVLARAMAKDPQARYQTALNLARALQAVETEQRWVPTPLVLLEERLYDHTDPSPGPGFEDRDPTSRADKKTRLRSPQQVDARLPASVPVDGQKGDDGRATVVRPVAVVAQAAGERVRQGMPTDLDNRGTVRRALPAVPESPAGAGGAAVPAPAAKRRSLVLFALSAVVLAAVVVVAVVLATHGHSPRRSPAVVSSPTVTVALPSPEEAPDVKVTPIGSSEVEFSWTEAGSQPGDTYVWWNASGGPQHATTADSVTLPAPACIIVAVDRSGELAQADPECGQ